MKTKMFKKSYRAIFKSLIIETLNAQRKKVN